MAEIELTATEQQKLNHVQINTKDTLNSYIK